MPYAPPTHKRPTVGKRHGQVSATDRQRTRLLHTGSKRWLAIRRQVLVRDLYCCRHCGRFADVVDHVDGRADHADPERLQALCRHCHGVKTAAETLNKSV